MNIEAISFLSPSIEPALVPLGQQAAPSGQFATWFGGQITAVNEQLGAADRGVQQLAAGDKVSLHQVMMDLEQAKLSLQLMMQVRTQVLDAFQEIMRAQL